MQKSAAERRSTNYHNEHITPKCNPNTHLYGNLIPSLFLPSIFRYWTLTRLVEASVWKLKKREQELVANY